MNRINPYEIQDIRERLAWAARHLYRLGYVKADVGNFSYKINDEMILIKPKGASFRGFREETFTYMDLNGKGLWGEAPSGEWRLHVEIYKIKDKNKPSRNVIIHTHPSKIKDLFKYKSIKETEKAISNLDEDCSEGLNVKGMSIVPELRRYSNDLAKAVKKSAEKENRIIILWKHGLVTIGETIAEALNSTEKACDVLEYF